MRFIRRLQSIIKHRQTLLRALDFYLFFLEKPNQTLWGSLSKKEEVGVERAIELAAGDEGPIIEIGALFGHTTNLIASVKAAEKELMAVENFSWNPFAIPARMHRPFTERTVRCALKHCNTLLVDQDVEQFYATYNAPRPSMVFIDAGHDRESVTRDIEWAKSIGCPVISGHDYTTFPEVRQVVDEQFGDRIKLFGSVWIAVQ